MDYFDPLRGEDTRALLDEVFEMAAHAPHSGDRMKSNQRRRDLFHALAARLLKKD